MSFLSKLFGKSEKSPQEVQAEPSVASDPAPAGQHQTDHSNKDNVPLNLAPPPSNASAAGTRSNLQNGGMAAGFVIGDATGNDPTMGMVEGMVAGNIISQRIQQQKNHEYWKGQEARYQAGDKDAAMPAPVQGGRDRSRNREGREERRKKRWDRRAARKGTGETDDEAHESESSSDERK